MDISSSKSMEGSQAMQKRSHLGTLSNSGNRGISVAAMKMRRQGGKSANVARQKPKLGDVYRSFARKPLKLKPSVSTVYSCDRKDAGGAFQSEDGVASVRPAVEASAPPMAPGPALCVPAHTEPSLSASCVAQPPAQRQPVREDERRCQLAKGEIKNGKRCERSGDLVGALHHFRAAQTMFPRNEKLIRRIAKLESEVGRCEASILATPMDEATPDDEDSPMEIADPLEAILGDNLKDSKTVRGHREGSVVVAASTVATPLPNPSVTLRAPTQELEVVRPCDTKRPAAATVAAAVQMARGLSKNDGSSSSKVWELAQELLVRLSEAETALGFSPERRVEDNDLRPNSGTASIRTSSHLKKRVAWCNASTTTVSPPRVGSIGHDAQGGHLRSSAERLIEILSAAAEVEERLCRVCISSQLPNRATGAVGDAHAADSVADAVRSATKEMKCRGALSISAAEAPASFILPALLQPTGSDSTNGSASNAVAPQKACMDATSVISLLPVRRRLVELIHSMLRCLLRRAFNDAPTPRGSHVLISSEDVERSKLGSADELLKAHREAAAITAASARKACATGSVEATDKMDVVAASVAPTEPFLTTEKLCFSSAFGAHGSYVFNTDDPAAVVHHALRSLHAIQRDAEAVVFGSDVPTAIIATGSEAQSGPPGGTLTEEKVSDLRLYLEAHRFLVELFADNAVTDRIMAADSHCWDLIKHYARLLNTFGAQPDLALGGLADLRRFVARLRASNNLNEALHSLLESLCRSRGGKSLRRRKRRPRRALGSYGEDGAWKYPRLQSTLHDEGSTGRRGRGGGAKQQKASKRGDASECSECREPVLEHNPGGEICCDLCLRWFHLKCLGLPQSFPAEVGEWSCSSCAEAMA